MANCEPCQNCEPVPCVQYEAPDVTIPCVDGEPCNEVNDAHCVVYLGSNLDNIGVKTNDRIDTILNSINTNHNSSGTVSVNNTDTIIFSGTGIPGTPLKADAIIDPIDFNMLVKSATGLKVLFTKTNILHLFDMIENDSDLQARFCDLLNNCANGSCGMPTGVVATIS